MFNLQNYAFLLDFHCRGHRICRKGTGSKKIVTFVNYVKPDK